MFSNGSTAMRTAVGTAADCAGASDAPRRERTSATSATSAIATTTAAPSRRRCPSGRDPGAGVTTVVGSARSHSPLRTLSSKATTASADAGR
jgi:hypothetical protein